jgi:hypothetical protein
VNLAKELSNSSVRYAALSNINHDLWKKYGSTTRGHMATLNLLRMTRMRPLLLAILDILKVQDVRKALKYMVDLAVRNLIVGTPGGILETKYCEIAKNIQDRKIKTAIQLKKACADIFPADKDFHNSFAIASSSKSYLARYYLRALEQSTCGTNHPEFVPNPNSADVNLEHVIPQKPHANWPKLSNEQHKALCSRMGNLVLMKSDDNSMVGNAKFVDKKKVLNKSSFKLTKLVSKNTKWGEQEIVDRQEKLATLAVKTWTGKFSS